MTQNAPFTIPDEVGSGRRSKFVFNMLLVLFLVVILLLGPVFNLWFLDVVFSLVGAGFTLAVFVLSLISARFIRTFPFCAKPVVRLGILIVGMIMLMCPIALCASVDHNAVDLVATEGAPVIPLVGVVYAAIKAAALDIVPGEWFVWEDMAGGLPSLLINSHAVLLLVFAVACPLAAVFAAFDAVVNGLSGARIRFWSWRKSLSKTKREIYVFHELDEYGSALAHNIIKTRKKNLPLLIFANVGDLEASRDETLMEDLLDRARGKAYVLYTSLPAETIPSKLSKRALKKCSVHYFAISENSTTNLQTAVGLWDVVFEQMWNETWQTWRAWCKRKGRSIKKQNYAQVCESIVNAMKAHAMGTKSEQAEETDLDPAIFVNVMDIASGLGIHCLHAHPDDEAILDSLISRSVESIVKKLDDERVQDHQALLKGIRDLTTCLHGLVSIRLLSQTELAVNELFQEHPLYEALDPIALADKSNSKQSLSNDMLLEEQQLTVLVIGCGTYGTQALKTAFWLGRFAGTQLKVVVVEKDNVRRKMEKLYLTCPGMMTERSYSEDLNGPLSGKWSIAKRHSTPTVRFCEMDYFSIDMLRLLSGEPVHTLWYEAGASPSLKEADQVVLTGNDHLYCIVCLGDDDTSLNAALDLQRHLSKRKILNQKPNEHTACVAGKRRNRVPIAIRVRNEYAFAAGQLGENGLQNDLRKLGFPLYPFGSLASVFTFEAIATDTLETKAMHANGAYDLAHHKNPTLRNGWMVYRNLSEFNKLQNRAVALSIPYKLWMLGLTPEDPSDTVSTSTLREALGGAIAFTSEDAAGNLFRKGLLIPKVKSDGSAEKIKDSDWVLDRAEDDKFRESWPLLAYVADLEHVRWTAFYRSLGWRDSLSVLDTTNADLAVDGTTDPGSRIDELKALRERLPLRKGTQHLDLRIHYYLCDNIDELGSRGIATNDHPFAYDRMILWYAIEILKHNVCK